MNKVQRNVNLLAILAYVLVAVALVISEAFAAAILVALLIITIILVKDQENNKSVVPVAGAVTLYFGARLVAVVFDIIVTVIRKFQEWRIEGLQEKLKDYTGDKAVKYAEKLADVTEAYNENTVGEVFDVIFFIVVLGIIALCVLSILPLLEGKDFNKTIVGKIVAPVVMGKEAVKAQDICPNCGKTIKGEFCANCGTKRVQ